MRERLWRIRLWGYDKHFPKVRELFPKVRDLFCLIKELCGQVGDLWRELHAVTGLGSEADLSRWKSCILFRKCSFRARIYTVSISRKKYSPLHTVRVFRWFSAHFSVKALFFKHSHGQQSIHMGGERLWRVEKASLHTEKPMKIIGTKQHNQPIPLWRVEKASLHTWNSWKSGKKSLCVKEWMLFSGNKIRIEKIEKTITWQPFTLQTSESYAIIKEWRPPWKNT